MWFQHQNITNVLNLLFGDNIKYRYKQKINEESEDVLCRYMYWVRDAIIHFNLYLRYILEGS